MLDVCQNRPYRGQQASVSYERKPLRFCCSSVQIYTKCFNLQHFFAKLFHSELSKPKKQDSGESCFWPGHLRPRNILKASSAEMDSHHHLLTGSKTLFLNELSTHFDCKYNESVSICNTLPSFFHLFVCEGEVGVSDGQIWPH